MKKISIFTLVLLFTLYSANAQTNNVSISGKLQKWNKITLSFSGDELAENDGENPFLIYRLNVTFKNKEKVYVVPGFYAADGNAAETSAKGGKVWQVRFRPDEIGEWTYEVSFRKGKNIAVSDDPKAGEGVLFDGTKGVFTVSDVDEKTSQSISKGRLTYVGERYLQFAGSKKYFIKGGADSPESFLGYYEFDQTPPSHKYEPHARDWKDDDPTWQKGKGKNIIGALNYLSSKGMNSVYFLTMNVQGDGKDVWPWIDRNERYRFDCSKLDQWEIVFDHMDQLGLMLHIVTQETENELLLDIGQLGVQRKLYYRELIARFSHHLAITWNLGEENGPLHWTPKGQDDKDRKAMAKYIKENDPYKNFVALHTHARPKEQDDILNPLLGYEYLDGPSIQIYTPKLVHETIKRWINISEKTDKIWVVNQDEIGPANVGVKPDADDPTHDEVRGPVLWGSLMAGGAGVEWYFGYKFAHMDLNCEDWRSRDEVWNQTKYALDFFHKYLPFTEMRTADDLTDNPGDYVFSKNGEIYAIYIPKVVDTKLNLTGFDGRYTIKWYNPRSGGNLQKGTLKSVKGGSFVSIGFPPSRDKDWVALLKLKGSTTTFTTSEKLKKITLEAVNDFKIEASNNNETTYYIDESNGALAIDASDVSKRNKFASSNTIFKGETGLYNAVFVSVAENDGESVYNIKLNGSILDTVVNEEVNETYKAIRHNLGKIYLYKNDIIRVSSKAVTNGKIPENNETAWSRGRWSSLLLIPDSFSFKEQFKDIVPFEEKDGLVEIEAEDFHYKSNNGTNRNWYVIPKNNPIVLEGSTSDNSKQASKGAYIEALPDTRVTHEDPLLPGENFFPVAGLGGIVSYKVKITTPGKYYIWTRAFSSGTEDNGVHVGINEEWPESGSRMQWCDGKNQWTWSSAQRVPENHCGVPKTIYLNIEEPGEHIISFSMREDGFEMDKWIMTNNIDFIPE